ncbi:MAG TPA: tetratricopeptide repeat protein, partial [Blastocatellia bacterium]|nr:tetratricopeptide repeat protein [Blastocatellia bacterium]
MEWKPEEDDRIRRYLLDDATDDERRRIEARLLEDDDYGERLLLIEDELIDDYARGALSAPEMELFSRNFLHMPQRREKLTITQEILRHASTDGKPETSAVARVDEEMNSARTQGDAGRKWWRSLIAPGWKPAVYSTLLLIALGIGISRWPGGASEVEKGLAALNRAYGVQRPIEARVTGFRYGVFTLNRGKETVEQKAGADYRELDEAEALLRKAARENADAESLHALGKLYLTRRDFDKALEQFEKALAYKPDNAQAHSDLGAALVEKLRSSGNRDKGGPEAINKAFNHINKALELKGDLLEALFNRALLYQTLHLYEPARDDWKKYLEKDGSSQWANEVRSHLEESQKKSSNGGAERPEILYNDFLQARQNGDDDKAWKTYNDSYLRYGNYITGKLTDDSLTLSASGREAEAEERLRTLEYLGRLSEQKSRDRFNTDLTSAYRRANKEQREMLAQGRRLRQSAYDMSFQTHHQQAIEAFLAARNLFAQADAQAEAVIAEYWIAEAYLRQSEHNKSLPAFLAIAETCERQNYRWLRALTFNRLAGVLGDRSAYSEALRYCLAAADEFKSIGDKSGYLRTLIIQSSLYRHIGKHREAINLCQDSLALANKVAAADDSWTPIFYAISGSSFHRLALYSAALEFQKEAVKMVEKLSHAQSISRYSVDAGRIYVRLKDYDTAISYIGRGLEIGRQQEQTPTGQDMLNYARLYLGQVYREVGKNAEAMKVLDQAAEFYKVGGWEAQSYLIA